MSGPEVLPPIYEKRVGRPPKHRRKQSAKIQGGHGVKMSRHGVKMHCNYCGVEGHNRGGCELRKGGVSPNLQPQRHTVDPVEESGFADEQVQHEDNSIAYVHEDNPIDYMYEEPHEDIIWHANEVNQPLLSQLTNTLISQLDTHVMLWFCSS